MKTGIIQQQLRNFQKPGKKLGKDPSLESSEGVGPTDTDLRLPASKGVR